MQFAVSAQEHIDYWSKIYFPPKSSDMEKIANLQRRFTRKIPEESNPNDWERFRELRIYSEERLIERYRAI